MFVLERLHKILAQHGIGSRREVERWIAEGRVQLNGRIAQVGDRYQESDRVQLDGKDVTKRLQTAAAPQVMVYHKPQGQALDREHGNTVEGEGMKSSDGETVQDRLPAQRGVRWLPINPMHPGDSGLLLLTNDGTLSYALTRHKRRIAAAYMVRVHVRGGVSAAPQLSTSLRLDNETVEFTEVECVDNTDGDSESERATDNVWYKVALARADKRAAVRALFVSHGLTISRMMQVAFADIELPHDLPRSRHRLLKPAQVAKLYTAAELEVPRNDHAPRHERGDQGELQRSSTSRRKPNTRASSTPARRAAPRSVGSGNKPRKPTNDTASRTRGRSTRTTKRR